MSRFSDFGTNVSDCGCTEEGRINRSPEFTP